MMRGDQDRDDLDELLERDLILLMLLDLVPIAWALPAALSPLRADRLGPA